MVFPILWHRLILLIMCINIVNSTDNSLHPNMYLKNKKIECHVGCSSSCIANYTCSSCGIGYDQDYSCDHCQLINTYKPFSSNNPLYVMQHDICTSISHYIVKSTWLPDNRNSIHINEPIELIFNSETYYDYGPCITRKEKQNRYRIGHWLELNLLEFPDSVNYMQVQLKYKTITHGKKVNVYYDISDSEPSTSNPYCYARGFLISTNESTSLQVPIHFDRMDSSKSNKYFIYIYEEEYAELTVEILITEQIGKIGNPFFTIDQKMADEMITTGQSKTVIFPMSSEGRQAYPACLPGTIMRVIRFSIWYEGDFSIVVSTKHENRIRYMQEFKETLNGTNECVQFWNGQSHGVLYDSGTNDGVLVRIDGNENGNEERLFSFISNEQELDISATFTAICPNNCNEKFGYGKCSTIDMKCKCNDKYGGDDCHSLCYYDGKFTNGSGEGQCHYGEPGCNSYCQCEPGYTLNGYYCVSDSCKNNNRNDITIECVQGDEGCRTDCICESSSFKFSPTLKQCVPILCGNNQIDDINLNGIFLRKEECDGGINCDETCHCLLGYIQDESNPLRCIENSNSISTIIGITISAIIIFVVLLCCGGILLYFLLRTTKFDINIYLQQQPNYYLYLSGSKKKPPTIENKYVIEPLSLDFGNENTLTAVLDTRFEKIDIRNKSGNKYMMVIFHTPNNPKFVFHFEPQVVLLRPRGFKTITCFMTLFCTTKIKDMKIPYSIWFSKSKSTLQEISEVLKNKTFEYWDENCQFKMNKLCKNVILHYHYFITIQTEAAGSTHIDMDELNIRENPIAEGAMGRVYIGEYRSVPVAVKQFRWENLTEEETNELKHEVIAECEMMSKLRNPFIANYMGSVTYIPQISMVIQFFVLGSLGEYIRKSSKDFLILPYNLKLRMLYDTARGMSFLHENNILHLDLKPDNLLVNSLFADSACCIKITDFGTSRFTKKNNTNSGDKGLGTPIYVAPEAYRDEYTPAGDVYSFAITAWEIFYQDEPYKEFKSLFDIKQYVEEGKRLVIDETMPLLLKIMIESCWKQNPQDRLTFEEICWSLVKMIDDAPNHLNLDSAVDEEKIKDFVTSRQARVQSMLDEY
ncbi:protein kinase domain containing protein [Entamoeba histolytica]|uniref:Protein kinase domain containing protein n=2 Tax=Entamoeba histolytica TaxID=5759 RepID=C4M420_ENTH1|nr:protein kinase domain containing protein [Entamoeba histolytica HM-1:IMSS]EAL46390.2 protein kinase domain containing protein [Entamoeba histolytica HM-1:IMSS]GAT96092.1 protein kinase domain containing protein [Entamoeba histolytica]|eukprot:XP_651776.2 protein kinase domain containing protein [Entamoeba histolytica HM-1:IMSS]